jgi:Txe/YoeB family toxin of Txe-Axe toxin-antitoxin module
MNERIKKLIKQATTIRYSGPGEIQELNPEKFAELLLEEFSKQVQIEGRFGLEREQNLIRICCKKAKKQFGVEE